MDETPEVITAGTFENAVPKVSVTVPRQAFSRITTSLIAEPMKGSAAVTLPLVEQATAEANAATLGAIVEDQAAVPDQVMLVLASGTFDPEPPVFLTAAVPKATLFVLRQVMTPAEVIVQSCESVCGVNDVPP